MAILAISIMAKITLTASGRLPNADKFPIECRLTL